MVFFPFEVTIPHIIYACLGGFIVLFGMFSLFLREKLYIGEACWAFLFGIVIGPYGAGIFDPRAWGGPRATDAITLEFTRVVLAIGVFAIGVELPKAYMKRHWRSLFFLLGPVMTWGWFVSGALIYALIPGLNFLSSLAIAACLTPTDPILAAAVIGGKYADKHVPAHIRHLLAAESGCNDGAAFPFLFIALYLTIDKGHPGVAIRDWFLILWLYQVIMGAVLGAAIGFGFRHLMKFCERRDLIDRHSYVAQYVSLAMLTIGVTTLLGSDDLLAAFTCGTAFAWDGFFNRQTEAAVFSSVIDILFNIAAFIFVGAWMPFSSFQNAELSLSVWRLIVIAILVLLLRRLPIMMALYRWIPDIKTYREAVFSGHFGPIGIGAIFISTLATEVLHRAEVHDGFVPDHQAELLAHTIQPITAFMVLCSISIHGLSIPAFSLGRRVHSVSRTWSRHTSMQPEWADQMRVVERGGENIVINRDTVDGMERGEKIDPSQTDSSETAKKGTDTPMDDEKNADTPPDGNDIISEWQEGSHRVIERRAGPGEEVEVEVIKDHGTPHSVSQVFRGNHAHAHEQFKAYMNMFHSAIDSVTGSTSSLPQQQDSQSIRGNATSSGGLQITIPDDDEEGWASDGSGPQRADVSASPTKRSKSFVRSSRVAPKLGTTAPKAKRRRNSFRTGDGGVTRGRTMTVESNTSDSSGLALKGGRLESVKQEALSPRSRDASPARSIRFADNGTRTPGTATPPVRSPMAPTRPGTPPTDDLKVTFAERP